MLFDLESVKLQEGFRALAKASLIETTPAGAHFHDSGQVEALSLVVAQGATGQQQEHWAEPLTASRYDVTGNFSDERNAGVQASRNDHVDLKHVAGDECENAGCGGGVVSQGRVRQKVAGL